MASGRLLVPGWNRALDSDGDPISARVSLFLTGTDALAPVYSDEELTIPLQNPVESNSAGRFPAIWASDAETYDWSVEAPYGPPGSPFTGTGLTVAITATILATEAAEAAADEASADAAAVESIYEDILEIVATGSDAAAIAARALRNGSNLTGSEPADFRTAIAAVGAVELAASGGSSLVGVLQSGTGAVAVTATAKLRQAPVQPNSGEFGAFTDATVTTATLLRAFTAAMANGRPVEIEGSYTINGPITPPVAVDGARLNIRVKGDVTITVDGGATAFNRVFYAESTTAVDHSISGDGTLTIDCNDKAACGIWLRHTEAAKGGDIFIDKVTVKNVLASTGVSVASGIFIIGRYDRVRLSSCTVEDVSRTDVSGECSGISVSDFEGVVEMYAPVVTGVLAGPGTADADGIKCFGFQSGGADGGREGSVRIYSPIFENNKGRSYKDQCGDVVIDSPIVRRDASVVVAINDSVEFDFQRGNGLLLNARYEYKKKPDGTSPVGASHTCVVFSQTLDDKPMCGKAINATLVSDLAIPRYALLTNAASALFSETVIDGLDLIPADGLSTTMISRAVIETNMATVSAKTPETIIRVKNVRGPSTCPLIGYTGFVTATHNVSTKLTWDAGEGCHNTLGAGSSSKSFTNIAQDTVLDVKEFRNIPAPGYTNQYINAGFVCDFRKLTVGTYITVDIATGVFTNAPSWGVSGYAHIRVDGQWFDGNFKTITVRVGATTYFTELSGGSWV